tara:strand:+ start:74 stop:370 length:297 start_codon:yes stop_codon:yes gene_type:complete
MNISINSSTIGIASGLLIQAAGIVYFISSLASTVEFNEQRLIQTEEHVQELQEVINTLSTELQIIVDNMQTINSEHRMLFDSGSYGDKKYLPGESRTY